MVPTERGNVPLSDAPPCSRVGVRRTDMQAGDAGWTLGGSCHSAPAASFEALPLCRPHGTYEH